MGRAALPNRTLGRLSPATLALFLALLAPFVGTASAQAQTSAVEPIFGQDDSEETVAAVKELMRRGFAEFEQGNFEAARDAFHKAWTQKGHPAIAASLADAEMKLGRYQDAAEHWAYYAKNLPADLADKRASAEAKIAECRTHLGSIRISLATPDAIVLVDGKMAGKAPLDLELWLEPGSHQVETLLGGKPKDRKTVSVRAGTTESVSLEITSRDRAAEGQPAGAPPAAPDRAPARSRSGIEARTVALISGGILTALGLGVGVGFHVKSLDSKDEADALAAQANRDGNPSLVPTYMVCAPPEGVRPNACGALKEKRHEQDTAATISTVGYIGAGAAALATAGMLLLWKPAEPKASARAAISIAPWGIVARATF